MILPAMKFLAGWSSVLTHNKAQLTFALNRCDCGDEAVTGGWIKPTAATASGHTSMALDHSPAGCEGAEI